MVRKIFLTIFLILPAAIFAQSGRIKPSPEPTPERRETPRIVYFPKQTVRPTPSPTPAKTEETDDVIRVESVLVPIPVAVTDSNGRSIAGLRANDFQLEIDDKPVEISEISRAETPVRLALLFDNSGSVLLARDFERKAAIKFFQQVIRPEKDLAALYSVASGTRLEQNLTPDVSMLVTAIENFPEPKGGTALLDGVVEAAKYLKDETGRRVIVIVSDGEDNLSDLTLEQTVRFAQSVNCQIYVVKTTDFENYKRTGARGSNANTTFLSAERRMQELARQTGGAVYAPVDERELDAAFARISAELSQQYVLNYYPEDDKSENNTFKKIAVKVKGRDNAIIRARAGYFVTKRSASQ